MTTKTKPRDRFPRRLKLLPGLRWKGEVRIEGPLNGGWLAAFDAEVVNPEVSGRIVYDRTVLTTKQVFDWTGVRL